MKTKLETYRKIFNKKYGYSDIEPVLASRFEEIFGMVIADGVTELVMTKEDFLVFFRYANANNYIASGHNVKDFRVLGIKIKIIK